MKNCDVNKCYYCKNFHLVSGENPGLFKCENRTNFVPCEGVEIVSTTCDNYEEVEVEEE